MEIKSAIKQRAQPDVTADNRDWKSATPVKCKCCNRPFANISAEGDLLPSTLHHQPCALCVPFLGLYNTLRASEREHTTLLDRGLKHHGRILAHEQLRTARIAFENFLVSIEAPNDAFFDVAQADFASCTEAASLERAHESTGGPKHEDDQNSLDDVPPLVEHASSTAGLPTAKRKVSSYSSASCFERKRIKFSENIEERIEYRGTLEYYRSAKEYVPGRYAVTEGSEYEDTSGSTLTFAKFTGQKKVGSKFIDIVPKEEAHDGDDQISTVKKRGKSSSEEACDMTNRPGMPEKDERQMNSRELRLSRRAKLNTPAVTTRLPSMSAQYDGPESPCESPEVPDDATTLVVALKLPKLFNNHVLTKGDRLGPVSEEVGRSDRLMGDAALNGTTHETNDHALITHIVSNIQHELKVLQQITVCSVHIDPISKAVRGCFKALEPLERLDCIHLHQNKEGECPQENDDSIYFDASDGISESACLADGPRPSAEIVSNKNHATFHHDASRGSQASLALDIPAFEDMPREGDSDPPKISKQEKTGKQDGMVVTPHTALIDTYMRQFLQTKTECSTKDRSCSEYRDGHATRHAAAPSHTSEEVATVLRSRSRSTHSTTAPDDRLPECIFDEVSARNPISKLQEPRAAPLRQSSALLYPALVDLREPDQRGISNDSNMNDADHLLALKLDGNENKTEGPHRASEAVPSSWPGFRAKCIDTSPDNGQTKHHISLVPIEPTLDASFLQPPRLEMAEDLHQGFGEWIHVQEEKQATHKQSQSEANNGYPLPVNNDSIGIILNGEADEESEALVTDTDRQEAGKEAMVGLSTAQNSVKVTTLNDRDLSADHGVENTIEICDTVLQGAPDSTRSPRDTIGDRDEANGKIVVESPRDYHTAVSQVKGQNGSFHLIGMGNSELDRADESIRRSAMKDVSRKQNRRRSSSRIDKAVSYFHEEPNRVSDTDNPEDETRPADATFAVPQMEQGPAPAIHNPGHSCTPDLQQRTCENGIDSATALCTDDATSRQPLATVQPGMSEAEPAAVEMPTPGWTKAGVTPSQDATIG